METEILHESGLSTGVDLLKAGEPIAIPTETVYGLAAPIFSSRAIEKVFEVKGRPSDNPLIAHIAEVGQAEEIAVDLPELFWELAERFFPGPLTLVVKKGARVPSIACAGLDTIAIRMPSHPLARRVIEAVGQPLVAPSANLSGRPSATTATHVLQDFDGTIAAVIDGGACEVGIESTVVDLVSFERPTILRPGSISRGELGEAFSLYTSGPKGSPGMRYRHYAPSIPVRRVTSCDEVGSQGRAFIIDQKSLTEQKLYFLLRKAEEEGYDEVVLYTPNPLSEGLENRLEKICESHCHQPLRNG